MWRKDLLAIWRNNQKRLRRPEGELPRLPRRSMLLKVWSSSLKRDDATSRFSADIRGPEGLLIALARER
jgi:hypothetical protein